MSIRVLYIFPGLVPPPKDPAFAEMAQVTGDITVDILLPTWDESSEDIEEKLGAGSFPTYHLGKLTYHLYPAGKGNIGTFRQKLAILWFHVVEGLRQSRKQRFDIVMGYGTGLAGLAALILSRLRRTKLIIRLPNVPEDAFRFNEFGQSSWEHSAKVTLKTRLARWVSDVLLQVLVLSSDRLHILYPDQLKHFPRLQKVPASLLPVFAAASRMPYTGISDNSLLLVGAPWYRKGADILIHAFRKLEADFPDWKLRMLGHFPDDHVLREMTGDSTQIEVLQALPNPETLKIIANCSVFVVASRSDSTPRVMVEAMAARKPIIGSRVGGIPEYVHDGVNGLLFENENVDDLSEKLRILMSSPELRERMGQAGYEMVPTRYAAEVWGRKMQEMIELTVNGATIPVSSEQTETLVS